MKLIIKQRNIKLSTEEKRIMNKRFSFCFSRLSETVKRVTITLEDINGPKGGLDKQCKIQVSFNGSKDLVLTERQSDMSHAIDRALQRASFNAIQLHKRKNKINYKHFVMSPEPEPIASTGYTM